MKTTYDYMHCENNKFSNVEFQALRNEIDMRVNTANSQGFSTMTICCAYLVGLMTFIGFFATFCLEKDTIIGFHVISDCVIALVAILLCSIPIYIMMAFSYKFSDNIRVIVNLGAYIKVFHDYPSLINNAKGKSEEDKMTGWELLHCNSIIPHGNKFANEYKSLSWIIFVLSIVVGLILFICMSATHKYFETFSDGFVVVVASILSLGYFVWLSICIRNVSKNTNIKLLMGKYSMLYFDYYIKLAVSLKLFSEDEAKELKDFYCLKQNQDEALIVQH